MGFRVDSDALSLTLPKVSRSKVRLRRPKRPSGLVVFLAVYTAWMAVLVIFEIGEGRYVHATLNLGVIALAWSLLMAERDGRQHWYWLLSWRLKLTFWFVIWPVVQVFLNVVGWY